MSLSLQFLSLVAMIGTGIVAGAFMDVINTGTTLAGKKSFIRRKAVWFDTIGWVLVGCGTFYVLFLIRDGAWRIYDPIAQISGILLYVSFFNKPFRFVGRIILLLIIKPIFFIFKLISSTIHQTIRVIVRILAFLVKPFVKLFRKVARNPFKNKGI